MAKRLPKGAGLIRDWRYQAAGPDAGWTVTIHFHTDTCPAMLDPRVDIGDIHRAPVMLLSVPWEEVPAQVQPMGNDRVRSGAA